MEILTIKEDKRTNALLGYKGWVTYFRLRTNDFVLSNTTLKIFGVILQTIDECKEYAKNNTPNKKKKCKYCFREEGVVKFAKNSRLCNSCWRVKYKKKK